MHPNEHDLNTDTEGEEAPSRSQLRREALDVLKLAHTLTQLSDAQLAHVPLDEAIRDEVLRARAVTQQIARKRQIQFLAKQLRKVGDEDIDAIRAVLEHDKDRGRREAAALHRIEVWRDRLIDQGDEALNELIGLHPQADRQQLRNLARQARLERESGKPLHAYRELFRLLREILSA